MDDVDITIDLDGVCVDTYTCWAEILDVSRLDVYKHMYGGRRGPVHDKIYGRNGEDGVYRKERELRLRQQYDSIRGASQTLQSLDEQGCRLAYLTSRRDMKWRRPPGFPADHTSRYEHSAAWLQRHDFPQPRIVGASDKGHVAASLGAKAHVDDSLRQVRKVNHHGVTGVLFDPAGFHADADIAEHYDSWEVLADDLTCILDR